LSAQLLVLPATLFAAFCAWRSMRSAGIAARQEARSRAKTGVAALGRAILWAAASIGSAFLAGWLL
jgi:hypothetical protein